MDDFMMSEKYGGSCRSLAGSMNNAEFDPCYSSGDEDDEDPVTLADLGAFDNVVRQHLKLRPTVSLVMEETEEELSRLLASLSEKGRKQDLADIQFTLWNNIVYVS